ncbi:F-box/LRR-repeat protein 2 isoform X2 [Chanodichthys erythropterus]|uniref:F-box/LRR-repeat protein 2 isoform X2 n=1 Tax=Chanodichthys erythropterus TaxID=933992 RepID=UPI00351F5694
MLEQQSAPSMLLLLFWLCDGSRTAASPGFLRLPAQTRTASRPHVTAARLSHDSLIASVDKTRKRRCAQRSPRTVFIIDTATDMNGITKSRFEVFSNSDEALINKKLPKELLLRIFSYLDVVTLCRCAQVSKAWNVLALDGSNWQKIDLFNFQTDIEGRVVENISKRCGGFLRQLSLRGCLSVGDASMNEGCRMLENLNLSWCDQITSDGIEALSRGCIGLRALFLRGCTQLDDTALKHLQKHCPELMTINMQSCTQITDDGFVSLCRGCHKLQMVCVSGCSNITDASLTALGLNCQWLKILEAARCSHVTDAGFTVLARNCHELEKMDLEECILVTDNTLVQLSIHCPRLQALSLSHCELITDDGIRHLSSSVCGQERLQVVELDNCPLITDITLEHLKSCQRLERIELYDCQQVSRAGIKRIRAHLPEIKVHAYFAPVTPPPSVHGGGQRLCRCCVIL